MNAISLSRIGLRILATGYGSLGILAVWYFGPWPPHRFTRHSVSWNGNGYYPVVGTITMSVFLATKGHTH